MITKSLNKRKAIVRTAVALICITVLFCIAILHVSAFSGASFFDDLAEMFVAQQLAPVVAGIIETSIGKILFGEYSDFFTTITNVIGIIALSILVVKVLIETVQSTAELGGEITFEKFMKTFIKMAVTGFVVMNAAYIAKLFAQGFILLMNEVAQTTASYNIDLLSQDFTIGDIALWLLMGALLEVIHSLLKLFEGITIALISLSTSIMSWGIVVEIAIRMVLMPFGVLSFMNTSSGAGLRFIKKYVAACLRMVIYAAAFAFSDYLIYISFHYMTSAENLAMRSLEGKSSFIYLITFLTGLIAWRWFSLGLARKADALAKDVMGVS